jgi:hypothetical protein
VHIHHTHGNISITVLIPLVISMLGTVPHAKGYTIVHPTLRHAHIIQAMYAHYVGYLKEFNHPAL